MHRIKMTSKGQLTLPKQIREKLRLRAGSYLEVRIRGTELVLKPVTQENDSEVLLKYCRQNTREADLDKARRIMSRVPVAMHERVRRLREEG
ncbi:MAG: AbrB/MazE/SpoVT family DNA-binding domain-containing protein [Bacillota bacterium]|nr:AbrB/MazE/SpoVT family DNA-binding domain-containing protein [Bacillota bacterium]